jgi:hypothetical protein
MSGCKKNTEQTEKTMGHAALAAGSALSNSVEESIVLPVPEITVTYTVPALLEVPEAPQNALDSAGNRTVKSVIDSTIKEVMHTALKSINEKISSINQDDYTRFLKRLKSVETGNLKFKSILSQFDTCSEYYAREYLLKQLNDSCKTLSKDELLEITVPTLKTDSNGVLRAGLVVNDAPDENRKLNLIKKAQGKVLIVTPQLVTAWPGDEKSAVGIIQPKDGPWEVIGFCSPTERFAERRGWLRNNSTTQNYKDVVLFKSYGEFVLIKSDGFDAAWLPFDSCAYIDDDYSLQWIVDAYKNGYVIFSQGYWKGDDVYGHPEPETDKVLMWGSLQTMDFVNLIQWGMNGNGKEFINKIDAELYSTDAPYSGQDFNISKIIKYKIEFNQDKTFEVGETRSRDGEGTWDRQFILSSNGGLNKIYKGESNKFKKIDPGEILKTYNINKIDELFKK